MKKFFLNKFLGSPALFVLTLVVIFHFIVTYIFIEHSTNSLRSADRDEIIQKIGNTLFLVESTSGIRREHVVAALADPDLHVTLTEEPAFHLQFTEISFWDISRTLHNNLDAFEISIQLSNDQWLNLNATVYSHFLFTQIFLVILEAIVFGAILFAAWSINRFTGPLKNFKRAAEELGVDLHTKPLTIYGPHIVRQTAEAMNTMQLRIQELIRDRTFMLAAISHDLRTPITRLKLRAQFLENETLYAKIIADLDEMESMISQTLSFAREDAVAKHKVKIDLYSLLLSLCDEMLDVGYDIHCETNATHIPFYGRPLALKRAFANLINNAIKYGARARVIITYHADKNIVIAIEDDGPGISEKELVNVLQPFYRADPSRSKNTGGVGLGLAVSKDIISHHHGSITLTNLPQGGFEARVTFPLFERANS